jgi:DNA polymerase-3 subunit alpha
MEYEVTGMYLSGHPLDEYTAFAQSCGCNDAAEFGGTRNMSALKNEQRAEIMVSLVGNRPHKTKSGAPMCFAEGEDKTGTVEIIVFPSVYETAQAFLKDGESLHIYGRVTVRNGEPPKLIADVIETGERFLQDCVRRDVCVRVMSSDREVIGEIGRIAEKYADSNGRTLALYLCDKRAMVRMKNSPNVKICRELLTELQEIAGIQNVRFMKRK